MLSFAIGVGESLALLVPECKDGSSLVFSSYKDSLVFSSYEDRPPLLECLPAPVSFDSE